MDPVNNHLDIFEKVTRGELTPEEGAQILMDMRPKPWYKNRYIKHSDLWSGYVLFGGAFGYYKNWPCVAIVAAGLAFTIWIIEKKHRWENRQ